MAKLENKILARELGKLGGFGSRLVAHFLPTEGFEFSLKVCGSPEPIRTFVLELLNTKGQLSSEFQNSLPPNSISAIVGSGIQNLNPTIIHVVLVTESKEVSLIKIQGFAKEGSLKQQSAEKAVTGIRDAIWNHFPRAS